MIIALASRLNPNDPNESNSEVPNRRPTASNLSSCSVEHLTDSMINSIFQEVGIKRTRNTNESNNPNLGSLLSSGAQHNLKPDGGGRKFGQAKRKSPSPHRLDKKIPEYLYLTDYCKNVRLKYLPTNTHLTSC